MYQLLDQLCVKSSIHLDHWFLKNRERERERERTREREREKLLRHNNDTLFYLPSVGVSVATA